MPMKNKFAKILLSIILVFNLFFLSGCWDSRELDQLFIVVGTAIDLAEDNKYELTMQIAKTQEASQSGTNQQTATSSSLILSSKNRSIVDAYMTTNENCSRGLLFDHNQVILFGESVARAGLIDVLDVFIRVQEARIEIPVVIVEGDEASIALKTKIEENNLSSLFIFKIVEGLSIVSKLYQTRIIDLMNQLLSESHASTIPMVKIVQKDGKDVIEFSGFALIRDDKMVGKLTQEQVRGFVFSMGRVSNLIIHDETKEGLAGFRTQSSMGKISAKIDENNQVSGQIHINGEFELDEYMGFEDVPQKEFAAMIKNVATDKLKNLVNEAVAVCQELQCDIFGFADYIWKHNPKGWRKIEENWKEIFADIPITVIVDIEVPSFGDVTQSIAIEKKIHRKENNIDGN